MIGTLQTKLEAVTAVLVFSEKDLDFRTDPWSWTIVTKSVGFFLLGLQNINLSIAVPENDGTGKSSILRTPT